MSVIADAYLAGVSTRRVEKLVQQLGVERMSKSQVSRLAKSLDQIVEDFRTRPLDGAPYAYVTLDALVVKCREGGRTVNVCVVHAVGVNRDGFRESLGLDVVTAEDGAAWLAYVRGLVARGLAGVKLVSSDAHPGLVDAIAATLTGAAWQRCRTHFMRNLLTRVPKSAQAFVATMVRTIFAQPDAATVREQHARIVAQLESRFPEAAALLDEAGPDLLAFTAFPKEHWRQLWSNNSLERLNKEIRRRTDVVGIFPDRASIVRLVGAVLAEQNDCHEGGGPPVVAVTSASPEQSVLPQQRSPKEAHMQYLGIDWGTRKAAWCATGEHGGEMVEGTITADEDGLLTAGAHPRPRRARMR